MLRVTALMLIAGLFLIGGLAPVPATAEPSFAGAWAGDKKKCRVSQEVEDAPILLTPKGYDQYETHCTFKTLMKKGRTYTADASCSIQGDIQPAQFVMFVARGGKSMTLSNDGGPGRRLQRCR